MKIIGNAEEIRWLKEAIANNCVNCPYADACNQVAQKELKKYGKVQMSCKGYLETSIEFIVEE